MPATQPILEALAISIGVPVMLLDGASDPVRERILTGLESSDGSSVEVTVNGQRFLGCGTPDQHSTSLVLGPFRLPKDPETSAKLMEAQQVTCASRALEQAALAVFETARVAHQRLELESQLEVTSRSVLAVTGELDLYTVLRRIVDLAREVVGARFGALGIPDGNGDLATFITSGMTAEQERRIGDLPRGRGILGLVLREPRTLRLSNLADHIASSGFPPNHPPMKSFLGVPIVSRDRVLGNLYLTEKRIGSEFTDEDARRVELLSGHAAVAIENANLYQALESQQQRLVTVVENSPEAVVLAEVNPERITVANEHARRLLGWQVTTPLLLDEYLARNERTTLTGEPMYGIDVPIIRSLRNGVTITRAEIRLKRPDGTSVTVLTNSSPIRDTEGNISGAVVIFQDITQIKEADQLKDDFISLVSHEMRTPLTTIQAGSKMLSRDWDIIDDTDRREILEDLAIEASRLGRLIDNTIQLAHIRAGRASIESEPVRLAALIRKQADALLEITPERLISCRIQPQIVVEANEDRLSQVVQNLLHNAIKYSPEDSPIDINSETNDGLVTVSIRDYGSGIAREDLETLFLPFRRTQPAVTSRVPGTGLGLYLSRQVIEAHGGKIWIEPPEDGGTCVKFTIPIVELDD